MACNGAGAEAGARAGAGAGAGISEGAGFGEGAEIGECSGAGFGEGADIGECSGTGIGECSGADIGVGEGIGAIGFARVAAATPRIRVADPDHNAAQALALARKADALGVRFLCLPELCLTGYTCGDLFLQSALVDAASRALRRLVADTAQLGVLVAVGLPLEADGKLYNAAAVFGGGRVYGFVPKTRMPNYGGFYELRHFTPFGHSRSAGRGGGVRWINWDNIEIPFSPRIIFFDESYPKLTIAVELGEDLWAPSQPSAAHAEAGALVIANLSASGEAIGKPEYRRTLVSGQSARLVSGYVFADAGHGESTQDVVFSGHDIICENGATLCESPPFGDGWAAADIDLGALAFDRRRMNTFRNAYRVGGYLTIPFRLPIQRQQRQRKATLMRRVDPLPFVPSGGAERSARCEHILAIQAQGLARRLEHTKSRHAVINVSGGLDSSLALIVTARAYELLGWPATDIVAATMPCFGTTSRTKANALRLSAALGVNCREIRISETVLSHLKDISHPADSRDVVYENAQARVRTLAQMDLANQCGGVAIGACDLSELALGWATFNGDHMSMYGVNAGVPKTLVRHIVHHVAESCGDAVLAAALDDILATPVSPELLPPDGDSISQRTESIIGPYDLHDFFIYHALGWGREPRAVFALARAAFAKNGPAEGGAPATVDGPADSDGAPAVSGDHTGIGAPTYTESQILKWMRVFYERFFAQQFKRSCMPEGPKVGAVSLSPRSGWRMPSDASCAAWIRELDALENESRGCEAADGETTGSEATGDEAADGETTGSEATGDEATGVETTGSEATGGDAR